MSSIGIHNWILESHSGPTTEDNKTNSKICRIKTIRTVLNFDLEPGAYFSED